MRLLDAMIIAMQGFLERFTPFGCWSYLRKLKLVSARWELAEESSDIGIYDRHYLRDTVYYSPGYLANLGYLPGEWTNRASEWSDRIHPDDYKRVMECDTDCHHRCNPQCVLEYRMRHKDGSWRWILDRGKVIEWDGRGAAHRRAIGTHIDITDRKKAEAELMEANRALEAANSKMKIAAEAAGIGFWEYDIVTDTQNWDEGILSIYGINPKEFTGATSKTWEDLLHPEDRAQQLAAAWKAVEDGKESFNQDFRILRADGDIRYVRSFCTITRDSMGKPLRLTGVNYDVTGLRLAKQRANQREAALRRILENLPFPVAVNTLTADQRIIMLNRRFGAVFGYMPDDIPTVAERSRLAYPDEAYRREVYSWWDFAVERAMSGDGIVESREFAVRAKDGTVRDVIFGATVVDELLVIAMEDITARKTAEEALEEMLQMEQSLRRVAEESHEAKSLFLASMSHEIRTPLSALVSLSQAMWMESDRQNLPVEFSKFLNRVRSGGQYLNLMLKNVLDVSAAESGRVPVHKECFYLADWVSDVRNILEPIADYHGGRLEWILPEDDELLITSDQMRLIQILINLVHNAVKYSSESGFPVRVVLDNCENTLVIRVEDRGPGIPDDLMDGVFDEFRQSTATAPSYDRGVGLGLAVVKLNVRLLGGTIRVWKNDPHGACFEVRLPDIESSPDEKIITN